MTVMLDDVTDRKLRYQSIFRARYIYRSEHVLSLLYTVH
jgi:hypothetical protein